MRITSRVRAWRVSGWTWAGMVAGGVPGVRGVGETGVLADSMSGANALDGFSSAAVYAGKRGEGVGVGGGGAGHAACEGDDAEGAEVVAAVLDLDHGAGTIRVVRGQGSGVGKCGVRSAECGMGGLTGP